MQVKVLQVVETKTPGRYLLKLSCGHDRFVRRPAKPTRKRSLCGMCAAAAGPRAAAIEIDRREREGLHG
jgi:hypothetical protein